MPTLKWTPPSTLTTALSTELNGLANNTYSALSAEIDNETGLNLYIDLELVIAAQAAARSSGAWVGVYIASAVDSTPNYPDTANDAFAELLAAFQLDATANARRLTKVNLAIPPLKVKLYVKNVTGQAFATSGNTLKYRIHSEQSV
ncbi:MAG TPA: hypothetical protein VNJ53_07805 [Gaiellaceae bacterium]|nr:hypothetical protein [Gaiellaceae bacterium]